MLLGPHAATVIEPLAEEWERDRRFARESFDAALRVQGSFQVDLSGLSPTRIDPSPSSARTQVDSARD